MPPREAQERKNSTQFEAACEAALKQGALVRFRANGQSMQPNVLDGDTVIVAPVAGKRLRRGDIVLARNGRGLLLHRVVGWHDRGGEAITRGDAGQQADLTPEQVLGRAVSIERSGRTIAVTRIRMRLLHALKIQLRRVRLGCAAKVRRIRSIRPVGFIFFCLAFLAYAPSAAAQAYTITNTANVTTIAPGQPITYTQVIANNSGRTIRANSTVTQPIPANTTFISMGVTAGTGTWPCTSNGTTITCTNTATYATGSTTTFTLVLAVSATAPDGNVITDTVSAKGENTGTVSATATVTVATADLSMTQTVAPSAVQPGATITYTETVTNNGPDASVGATLYQHTPPNTVFTSMTPPTGWTCGTVPAVNATGQVICTANANIPNGTLSGTFTYVVTVNTGTAAGTTIVNAADVTAETSDPVSSNNATYTSTIVELGGDADLGITMAASPTPVFVSSTLTYTIEVQNYGLTAGSTVTVADTYPPTLVNPVGATSQGSCAAPAGGEIVCTLGTVAYPLGAPIVITITGTTPGTAGTLTNSATVSTSSTDPYAGNNTASAITVVQPLVCATPGKDGAPSGPLSGIVNTYYAGVGTPGAGTNSLTVTTPSSGSSTQIGVGDLLLVIQMQDAQINSTNTSSYGDGVPGDPASGSTSLGSSGEFEFVTVTAVTVNATTDVITIQGTGANGGLLNTYTSAADTASQGAQTFQVIRVPQYTSATLSSSLVALSWNGSVGGVLALDVASQLTLGGTVVLDGQGFRGGGGRILGGAAGTLATDDVTLSTQATNGSKAEGIAGTPHYIAPPLSTITDATTATSTGQAVVEGLPAGSYARGAPGNAGGGATDANPTANNQNSGGGGGGNGGTGGTGGFGWNSAGVVGGFGGVAFPSTTSAIVMGGGGGAGTSNDGSWWNPAADTGNADCGTDCTGIYSSGTAGGGIVIIHAGSVIGTGTITSNGVAALSPENDGGGGGGAGGTIMVLANSGTLAGLTVEANGGNGGNTWPEEAPGAFPGNRHGPGGGGGGGVIFASWPSVGTAPPSSWQVLGGIPGTSTLGEDAYGATIGQNGGIATGLLLTETPGTQSGAYCAGADLAVTNAGTPNPVAAGSNITYTQTVANNGPLDAVNAVLSEVIPANTTFQSLAITGTDEAGWTCTTPAVNGTGVINCTNPDVPAGAAGAASFKVIVNVNPGTASGTQIADTVSIASGTNDPNLANNSATVLTIVTTGISADLTITNSATPNPVPAGTDITYTVVVTNNGPSAASGLAFTEALPLPGNTSFISVTVTSGTTGWTCPTPTTAISCTIPTFAVGASTTFTVVVSVSSGTASGTVITDTANISSSTPDPNPSSNSATATVVVATSGQADLAVTKTGTPNPVLLGNKITYTITVTNNGPAAAANVTMADTLPAGTTEVSISTPTTPAGWTCLAPAGGVQKCTNSSLAMNSISTFTLIVTVNTTTASGTVITNTANVSSTTTTDPNPGNNTATASTVAESPSDADVTITKTGAPEPVDEGTNLTYTIQVADSGPEVAENVSVTDTLPTEVTFNSVFIPSSEGTCSAPGATITCNLNPISVGGLVTITINVTAATFSSTTDAVNTATVSWNTTNDPTMKTASSTWTSTIVSPTAVSLTSFRAQLVPGGGVVVEWKTSQEMRNLGFHVYRDNGQGRQRLDPSIIAGSALLFRGGSPQHRARSYRWLDPQGSSQAAYWVEDVDFNGTSTLHGPVYPEGVSADSAPIVQARLLNQMNQTIVPAPSPSQHVRMLNTPPPVIRAAAPGGTPVSLNQFSAVKISVSSEGWYSVASSQLVAAGMPQGTDSRSLQLYAEGIEQPIKIVGRQSGPLGPNDSIQFYGTGIDTPFSGTRIYWLVWGRGPAEQIVDEPAYASNSSGAESFPFTVLFEQRTTYFAALLNGDNNDNYFGALVTSAPVDQDIAVTNIDPNSSIPQTIDVTLQGATEGQAHNVSVVLNGTSLGEMNFTGEANVTNTFAIPAGVLQDGTNDVTLTALDGDNDVSLVQSIEVHYAHTYNADSDWLRATAAAGSNVRIGGFSNPQIQVFDITNPLQITQLSGMITLDGSAYDVTLQVPGSPGTDRTLLAFSSDQISAPDALAFHAPNNIDRATGGADMIVIANPSFESNVAPLVTLHESQGTSVSVVTTDEIYDAFNYGEHSPFALRAYLQFAASEWRTHPQALLLVGDASVDPRNYLGFGDFDFVPTRIIETAALKTASDDWLTDFNQTGFATIPTGRLPARTAADANLMVSKILGYEAGSSVGSWDQQALLVADQNIGADFTDEANSAAADLPSSLNVTKILADGQDPSTVEQQIVTAINNGALLVNYTGHGSEEQWSFTDFFDDSTAAALTNGDKLPVFLLMDCLNGLFQDVYSQSLSKALILAPNGGAVAVWASSGFTVAPPQGAMDQALLSVWAANPATPIGQAVLTAKTGVTDPDVRRTWILFGDPLMQLQLPAAQSSSPQITTRSSAQMQRSFAFPRH